MLFSGIFLLCVENFQCLFQRHAAAGFHQQGVTGLDAVEQGIRCLAVVVGVQGLLPLGGGHHGGALGLLAVSHQTVQVALSGQTAHEELGRLAAESDLYCLVTYGENAKRTAVVAAAKGVKTLHANNYREAADALLNRIEPGDALLVKASRGMALEKVLEIFYAEQKDAEE